MTWELDQCKTSALGVISPVMDVHLCPCTAWIGNFNGQSLLATLVRNLIGLGNWNLHANGVFVICGAHCSRFWLAISMRTSTVGKHR
eukprot:12102238-Karenia_brevis.AAC.1